MSSAGSKLRIVREPVEVTVDRLETYIARMEHRYECESSNLTTEVAAGRITETAEISRWLTNYWTLKSLREPAEAGHTTGSPTRNTR